MKTGSIAAILLAIVFNITTAQGPAESDRFTGLQGAETQDSLFQIVMEHNKALRAARDRRQAKQLESQTGQSPGNPTVELGYLSGYPESIGNRLDFRVSQEFDFPTAYIHLSRAGDLKAEEASLVYELYRQDILSGAWQLWIDGIYLNKVEALLSRRLDKAELLHQHFRQLVDAGEEGQLALSQSNLQTVALKGALDRVRGDIRENGAALQEVTGGMVTAAEDTLFPEFQFPAEEQVLEAYSDGPAMKYYGAEAELKKVQQQLAVSHALPKFSAGYYSETVIDQRFRGVSVGITVPLWEHANRLKHAKAEVIHAASDRERYRSRQHMELSQKMVRWERLGMQISELQDALSQVNDESLLSIALELGEISLSEYIFATELYFQNVIKLMEYQRERLKLEADLLKIYY